MQPNTLLLRQVHPSFRKDGRLLSIAFRPFPRDAGLLSVYDGDLISPEAAHRHYTDVQRLSSVGVWAVTNGEAATIDLPARADAEGKFAEHAVIDFSANTKKDQDKKAKLLVTMAEARGCLYAPPIITRVPPSPA